ncbi:MAG: cytochrome c [Deltaproteobacteria bacterium]|nr:cytochrome c [Deltaproteobacteria bacterium]
MFFPPFLSSKVMGIDNLFRRTFWLMGFTFWVSLFLFGCTQSSEKLKPEDVFGPPQITSLWEEAVEEKVQLSAELLGKGKELYKNYCARCHGLHGKGDGENAKYMVTRPRDFTTGIYKFRTTSSSSVPSDEDLFRTITTGFSEYGMPSFRHLKGAERWALVYFIKTFSGSFQSKGGDSRVAITGEPPLNDDSIAKGKEQYKKLGCFQCHGAEGRGDGPSAALLKDSWGYSTKPLDFTRGRVFFKGGYRAHDVMRILVTGIPGTPMPSYAEAGISQKDLWHLAHFVEDIAGRGEEEDRAKWRAFFEKQSSAFSLENAVIDEKEESWDAEISKKFRSVTEEQARSQGCLSCHAGIEVINDKMQPYLLAFGGGAEGRACVVCHEGNPDATTKKGAHHGMFPNPGSMWVVSFGKGCAKCHSSPDALTTVHGIPLPRAVGGSLMSVRSSMSDPSHLSGENHIYRMQRGLMSLEFGKASHTLSSNGVIPKGLYLYSDFDMDDPDGPVPTVGTDEYKEWIRKAIEKKFVKIVERSEAIPTFDEGAKLWGDEFKAVFADYYRKECARCHVWEEGRRERGDLRAGGCSSCHSLYTNDGIYEGNDPTIPKNKPIHPIRHELSVKIPAAQCNHCHTRGKRIGTSFVGAFEFDYKTDNKGTPFNEKGEPQDLLYTKDYIKVQEDIHFQKGIQCMDCHTSIDVHGDGNIYPSTLYQVEIQCADCHGTPKQYPWELPLGWGTPVELGKARGTYHNRETGKVHLLTSRGNPRVNLEKRGDKVVLTGFHDGKEHDVPLLKEKALRNTWKTEAGKVAMHDIPEHLNKVECYSCHSSWAPQCYGCHNVYDRREKGVDWQLTALAHNPLTGKQKVVKTPGKIVRENRSFMRWEEPLLAVNVKGRVSPAIPGCQVFMTYIDEKGNIRTVNKIGTTSDGLSGLTLAPVQPHTNTIPARTCESCHTNPKSIGYGTANSRSQEKLQGDAPLFVNMAEGFYGDLPDAKTGKWQVPKIPEFPYTLDQLVTRSGKQVQNMPHIEDHPLTKMQRDKVEREGLCIACHKHYNTPLWEKVRSKTNRALTPQEHDKAVESALKALAEGASEVK